MKYLVISDSTVLDMIKVYAGVEIYDDPNALINGVIERATMDTYGSNNGALDDELKRIMVCPVGHIGRDVNDVDFSTGGITHGDKLKIDFDGQVVEFNY